MASWKPYHRSPSVKTSVVYIVAVEVLMRDGVLVTGAAALDTFKEYKH